MTVTHHRSNSFILLLLGLLCVVTPLATDMYISSFTRIAAELHRSTPQVSLSLSAYLLGFALGQLFYGPLLDRFGRKRPLYFGLSIYILSSIGCAAAPDLQVLVALRFVQALGGCVAQVCAIAMVRDFFPLKESAKVLSTLFLLMGISPLLAPTVGSFIVSELGWRWIFVLLGLIGTIVLALTAVLLPEGHAADHSVLLNPRAILIGFWSILREPQFFTYTLAGSFSFAGLITYISGSPIVFIDGFHLSTRTFAFVFAGLVIGFAGGNQLNLILLRRFSIERIFLLALWAQVIVGSLFLVAMLGHANNLATSFVMFFMYLFCIGLTYPNGAALGMARFSKDAGRASALLGSLQIGTGAIVSTSIGVIGAKSVIPLLLATALLALFILLSGRGLITQPTQIVDNEPIQS